MKSDRMNALIFWAVGTLAVTVLCFSPVLGNTPAPTPTPTGRTVVKTPAGKTEAKTVERSAIKVGVPPMAIKRRLPPITGTYRPEIYKDVQIKNFYIVKEPNDKPYTAMVHVVNLGKKKLESASIRVDVVYLDANKKVIQSFVAYGGTWGNIGEGWAWGAESFMDLVPGENVVKVPFFPPPAIYSETKLYDPQINQGKGVIGRFGFVVRVAQGVVCTYGCNTPISISTPKGISFAPASYTDFLPQEYMKP